MKLNSSEAVTNLQRPRRLFGIELPSEDAPCADCTHVLTPGRVISLTVSYSQGGAVAGPGDASDLVVI